jgi:hypothetical protein
MPDHFRIRVWAVIGDGSTGKSTVTGGLVSQFGRGMTHPRRILLRGAGHLLVHARRQSLQEANVPPKKFISDMRRTARALEKRHGIILSDFNVLVAIRTDSINRLPTAKGYLSDFVHDGWDVQSIVVLDYSERHHGSYYAFGAPLLAIRDASSLAQKSVDHQRLIGQVRNHFGWA